MADTFTTLLDLTKFETGTRSNTWGDDFGLEMDKMDTAIAGVASTATTGGTTTLTKAQARARVHRITGTLVSNATIEVPATTSWYIFSNETSGAFTVTVRPAGGSGATIGQGGRAIVLSNGSAATIIAYQPLDATLTALAGVSTSADQIIYATASDTFTTTALTAFARSILDDADAAAVMTTLGFSAYFQTLVNDADAATARATLGLGSAATLTAGTGANNVVQLDGSSRLPAVDGSQLTNLPVADSVPVGAVMPFAQTTAPTGWLKCNGAAVSRTTYATLFAAITRTATANTTNASNSLSSVSVDFTTSGVIGAIVEGTNIPAGTTITGVTSNTLTMSANATGTSTGVSIRLLPFGRGDGSTTFNVPDLRGEFVRGWDDARGVDTSRGFGIAQAEMIGPHNHTATTASAGAHSHAGSTALSAGAHSHTYSIQASAQSAAGVDTVSGGYNSSTSTSTDGAHTHSLSIVSDGAHTHTVTVNNNSGTENRPRNIALLYCIKH